MTDRTNEFGQTIGCDLPDWVPRELPAPVTLEGRFCRLEPINAGRHAADLHAAFSSAPDARLWTYMTVGPFADAQAYHGYLESAETSADPRHYAVIDLASGKAVGTMALMRIDPKNGVIEVGSVTFSPLLQQTPISTEAQYLLMAYVFDQLGYRRYEWKCDHFNEPSRKTARRLGFSFEGIFRQAVVYKGRSRDTAWFAIIDSDWPKTAAAFQAWLSPGNFDASGRQKHSLAELRGAR